MSTPGISRGIITNDQLEREQVGSTLLHELAEGLYGWQEVIREYVQNALDSHVEWEELNGELPQHPIQIEVRPDRLCFYDYGVGMNEERARNVKAIGVTTKAGVSATMGHKLTGYKGVGIWAGLSFFEELIIDTTEAGSELGYQIRINFKGIKDAIAPNVAIFPVVDQNHEIEIYDADSEEHHTTVTLLRPRKSKDMFLSPDAVREQVGLLCPCTVDPEFHHAEELEKWHRQHDLPTFEIVLNGTPIYRKYVCPFYSNLDAPAGEFRAASISVNNVEVAQVWYVLHRKNDKLASKPGNPAGLRLLQNGFMMGPANLYSQPDLPHYDSLAPANYLQWHTGEIYVTWDQLKPNLRRNEFQESDSTREFVESLREWYRQRIKETRDTADKRSITDKFAEIKAKADRVISAAARGALSAANVKQAEKFIAELKKQNNEEETGTKTSIKTRTLRQLRSQRTVLIESLTNCIPSNAISTLMDTTIPMFLDNSLEELPSLVTIVPHSIPISSVSAEQSIDAADVNERQNFGEASIDSSENDIQNSLNANSAANSNMFEIVVPDNGSSQLLMHKIKLGGMKRLTSIDVALALVEEVLTENSVSSDVVNSIMSDLEQRFSSLENYAVSSAEE